MKKQLQRILSLLCVLAMVFGAAAAFAEDTVQYETRVISVEWKDDDNVDGIRPDHVDVKFGDIALTLTEKDQWVGSVSVPAGTQTEWSCTAPEGYIATFRGKDITILSLTHAVPAGRDVTGTITWEDNNNAVKVRPKDLKIMLLADGELYGEPMIVKEPAWKATWKDAPIHRAGSEEKVVYSIQLIQAPAGYDVTVSGLEATAKLQTGSLSLSASFTGAPEGTDLSSLFVTVYGPDPSMPKTVSYADLAGGYDLGTVLPGAYVAKLNAEDDLVEGYNVDGKNSQVADAVFLKAGETASLQIKYAWTLPEDIEADEDYDPEANIGKLTFTILGPDPRMPMTITYSQFTNGKYELDDLVPGIYVVKEMNAETLVDFYYLTADSETAILIDVGADGIATAKLFNQYRPAPTPEPDAEFVDIPVTKTWNDNNDKDGNRPDSITARLYADGVEVDSHVLTAAENWTYTFTEKPRYREDNKTEIVYSVNEDAVAMYAVKINGFNIVNDYQPEVTRSEVQKVWVDNENARLLRPNGIAATLYAVFPNGEQEKIMAVSLNSDNGWSYTVENLSTVINGLSVQYVWKEDSIIGYTSEVKTDNGIYVFTNTIIPPVPPTVPGHPQTPDKPEHIDDYKTPLGVEVEINHVGDCFD